MLPPSSEPPLYSVHKSSKRAIIPKALSLVSLAFIFYLGVLVNISLLELNADQETALKTGALIVLALVIFVGMMLTLKKTHQPYLFYRNRISQGKETIYYLNITNTNPMQNSLDKFFKTYSIPLGKTFTLRNLPESIPLSNYLQQLIEYAKKNQF